MLHTLIPIYLCIQHSQQSTYDPHNHPAYNKQPDSLVCRKYRKDGVGVEAILGEANFLVGRYGKLGVLWGREAEFLQSKSNM